MAKKVSRKSSVETMMLMERRHNTAALMAQALVSTRAQHRLDMIGDKAEEIAVTAYAIADYLLNIGTLNAKGIQNRLALLKTLNAPPTKKEGT